MTGVEHDNTVKLVTIWHIGISHSAQLFPAISTATNCKWDNPCQVYKPNAYSFIMCSLFRTTLKLLMHPSQGS